MTSPAAAATNAIMTILELASDPGGGGGDMAGDPVVLTSVLEELSVELLDSAETSVVPVDQDSPSNIGPWVVVAALYSSMEEGAPSFVTMHSEPSSHVHPMSSPKVCEGAPTSQHSVKPLPPMLHTARAEDASNPTKTATATQNFIIFIILTPHLNFVSTRSNAFPIKIHATSRSKRVVNLTCITQT
jgi:hypothetical protein